MSWIQDDISAAETTTVKRLRWTAKYNSELGQQLRRKPWVRDDITEAEAKAIEYLYWAGRYVPELAGRLLLKSWIADGITADEATVIRNLYWTARPEDESFSERTAKASMRILDMPFLDSVEAADAQAVRSLQYLEAGDSANFLEIMGHGSVADGITDEEAKIVALIGGTYSYRPESADFLLHGTGVYLEERVVELPMSGEMLLAIIRIRNQKTPSMDFLEHSVRTVEEFMGEPLPTEYIALFFDDAVFPGSGGTNFETHFALQLIFDVEDGEAWWYTPFAIAHEVAHYYWRGNMRSWIKEGAAELLGSISEEARDETPVDITNYPCSAANTIAELEALEPEKFGTKGFDCHYSLGERLFLDLYESLGEDTFQNGFRSLYRKSLMEDPADDCEGTELGICHLVAAFKADAPEDVAAKVDEIVARWYGVVP